MLHCQFHNLQNFISQPSSSSSMHSPMFPCPGLGCWLQLLRSPVPALALGTSTSTNTSPAEAEAEDKNCAKFQPRRCHSVLRGLSGW